MKVRKHEYGTLDPQELLQKLNQEGISGAKLQHMPTMTSIQFVSTQIRLCLISVKYLIFVILINVIIFFQPDDDTFIQITDNSTNVFCTKDQKLRRRLRNVILQCLKRF